MRLSGAWRAKRAPLKGAIMDIEYPCGKDVVEAVLTSASENRTVEL